MTLLERDASLRRLAQLLGEARGGAGALVFVGGEAGVGKTSLVRRFASDARDVRVAVGTCDPLPAPPPLGPLMDVAEGLALGPFGEGASPAATFRAVRTSLASAPTLLVIEDGHWADEASLDLLRFLGRRASDASTLIVATYRDDETVPGHPLRTVLGELATAPRVERMTVRPLSPAAVAVLAADREVDVAELHRRTGGNPFFVTEILASDGEGVPASVHDAVLARAAGLTPSARAVLDAAAVVGPRIEPALLDAVTAGEARHVDAALARGLLVPRGPVLEFRHDLARQAIVEAIPPHRRRTLHRLALEAMTDPRGAHGDPARLAHHAEGAQDAEAVLTYAVRAAERASALSSHREAAAQYERALRFAAGRPPAERARLLERFAWETHLTDRLDASIAARRDATAVWRAEGRPERQGENLARLSHTLIRAGRNAEAEGASRASLELLEPLPEGPERALAYRFQSYLRMLDRDLDEAVAWGERAIEAAERFGDVDSLLHAYNSVGSSYLVGGQVERGRELLERAVRRASQAGMDHHVADAYDNLGSGAGEVMRLDLAEEALAATVAFAEEHDIDAGYARAWQALVHLHRGRYREAGETALPLATSKRGASIRRIMALVALGRLRARRGDPEADAALDEALTLAEETATLQRLAPVRAARAEAAWFRGDRERVRAEATAAYPLAAAKGHAWFLGELAYWRWRVGDLDEAPPAAAAPFALQIRGDWRAAAEAWRERGCPFEEARALAEGDDAREARRALAIFEALGARPAAAALAERLGATLRDGASAQANAGTASDDAGLTRRQRQVLALLAGGLSDAEIAARLYRSPKTIGHHVSAILAKLDVRNRTEAAREALRRGIVPEE